MQTTQQMLLVIPYCQKDAHWTEQLLAWIGELSPKLGPHCCLLAADVGVPHATKMDLQHHAKTIFYHTETAIVQVPSHATKWPESCNAMFQIVATHIQECFRLPWFWMEPDCIPLVPSWLDELAIAYNRCPKPFMGCLMKSDQPNLPPIHMAGCGIYPCNTANLLKSFLEGPLAWDMASAPFIVPRSIHTPLIHNHYGTMELPPTFKEIRMPADPINTCTLDFIHKGAVVFHRCKDGTLIDVLRKARHSTGNNAAIAEIQAAPAPTPTKRGPGRPRKAESVPA